MPPTVEQLFRYEPDTGALYWLIPGKGRQLNRRAGCFDRRNNRWVVCVNGILELQHRVIWKLQTGKWPLKTIDHKDGDGSNNRWENLREASRAEQNQNRLYNNNQLGLRNIHFDPRRGKYIVQIRHEGKLHSATFLSLDAAQEWRDIQVTELQLWRRANIT